MTAHDAAPASTSTQTTTRLLYDRRTAATQLSISVRSLDYMITNGTIKVRRIGSRVLVPHTELVRAAGCDHEIKD
jgi:hypothetical protein